MGSKQTDHQKAGLSGVYRTGFETSTSTGKGEKNYKESIDPNFGKVTPANKIDEHPVESKKEISSFDSKKENKGSY